MRGAAKIGHGFSLYIDERKLQRDNRRPVIRALWVSTGFACSINERLDKKFEAVAPATESIHLSWALVEAHISMFSFHPLTSSNMSQNSWS